LELNVLNQVLTYLLTWWWWWWWWWWFAGV